jgi:hypothetical protein
VADVVAVEDLAEALERRVLAQRRRIDLAADVAGAVDEAEVARVEVLVKQALAPGVADRLKFPQKLHYEIF